MVSPVVSSARTPSANGGTRGSKSKPTKIVKLRVPSPRLLQFPHVQKARKPSVSKASSAASTPITPKESPVSTDSATELKPAVPAGETANLQVPADTGKKRGVGGPKPGTKRPLAALSDGVSKPRAKPGPKKRPRLEGALGTDEAARPWTTPAPIAGHKLGPKANQGAINAGLRALDRTGKPCRKWEKKGFSVKSFTGVTWHLPSWRAPKKVTVEIKGDGGQSSTLTSNSENQVKHESSNIGSENDRNGAMEVDHAVSSPLPSVATPA